MEIGQKVKIISDSTCDLSQELTAKYDIDILPLHILLGENEFRDGKDTTPDRIFAWADANKATPKTSAPSLEDAKVLLQPYVEVGRACTTLPVTVCPALMRVIVATMASMFRLYSKLL